MRAKEEDTIVKRDMVGLSYELLIFPNPLLGKEYNREERLHTVEEMEKKKV